MRKSRAETDIRRHIALVENREQWTALALLILLLLALPFLLRWLGAGGWLMFTNFTLLTVVAVTVHQPEAAEAAEGPRRQSLAAAFQLYPGWPCQNLSIESPHRGAPPDQIQG